MTTAPPTDDENDMHTKPPLMALVIVCCFQRWLSLPEWTTR